MFFLFSFFSQGGSYRLSGSRMALPPKSSDRNSEIAILFTIVEKPNNYVFGGDLLTRSQWEGLQVTNFDLCLRVAMVTGKCTDVLREIFRFSGES